MARDGEGKETTHDAEAPVGLGLEDQHHKGREQQRAGYDGGSELPGYFTLAGAGVGPAHDEDGVEGREDVEHFEEVVPWYRLVEEVEVAGAEDYRVEDLGDEGDACFAVSRGCGKG